MIDEYTKYSRQVESNKKKRSFSICFLYVNIVVKIDVVVDYRRRRRRVSSSSLKIAVVDERQNILLEKEQSVRKNIIVRIVIFRVLDFRLLLSEVCAIAKSQIIKFSSLPYWFNCEPAPKRDSIRRVFLATSIIVVSSVSTRLRPLNSADNRSSISAVVSSVIRSASCHREATGRLEINVSCDGAGRSEEDAARSRLSSTFFRSQADFDDPYARTCKSRIQWVSSVLVSFTADASPRRPTPGGTVSSGKTVGALQTAPPAAAGRSQLSSGLCGSSATNAINVSGEGYQRAARCGSSRSMTAGGRSPW